MSEHYNGYMNYETWCVALWLDNDENAQTHWNERAQEIWDELGDRRDYDKSIDRDGQASYDLATELQDCIEGALPPGLDGMFKDLLTSALNVVNWDEIARGYIEEVDKTSEEEEV